MVRRRRQRILASTLGAAIAIGGIGGAALLAAGCSRRGDPGSASPATRAEWAWLQAAKSRLDAERAQLASLGGPPPPPPAAAPPVAPIAPTAPADPTAPDAATRDAREREIDTQAAELGRRLIDYINADPPVEGTPLSARQQAAIRMKSDEDIAAAEQFVDRAGDYRRALEILNAALALDPVNPRLHEQLARVQAARYLTAERFAHVSPGMTAGQVRQALGPPNIHDVRSYPQHGERSGPIVAWFYPRDPNGTAAAVWFSAAGGSYTAYRCDWDALPPATAAASPAGTGSPKPATAAPPQAKPQAPAPSNPGNPPP